MTSQAKSIAPSAALAGAVDAALDERTPPPAPERGGVWRAVRRALAAVCVILLGLAAAFSWRAYGDRASIPLSDGHSWRFNIVGTGETVSFHVDGTAQFKDREAWLVSCERGDQAVGRGYLVNRWLGLDLVGAQGTFGERAVNLRLIPYPLPQGGAWTSRLGEAWTDRWKATSRGESQLESVSVPAGTFEALRIRLDVQFASQPPVASVDYWIARGVGPVKIHVAQRGYLDADDLEMELAAFSRGP